jgi:hypothetical protein
MTVKNGVYLTDTKMPIRQNAKWQTRALVGEPRYIAADLDSTYSGSNRIHAQIWENGLGSVSRHQWKKMKQQHFPASDKMRLPPFTIQVI